MSSLGLLDSVFDSHNNDSIFKHLPIVSHCIFKKNFFSIMKWIASIFYTIICLVFIPVFIVFMVNLKKTFISLYESVCFKVLVAFSIYMVLIVFRLVIYLIINWIPLQIFDVRNTRCEIPFYVSEILISLFYILGLLRVYGLSNA